MQKNNFKITENFKKQLTPENIKKAKEIQGELSKKTARRGKLINLQDLTSEVSKKLTTIESINKYLLNINSLLHETEVSGIILEIFSYEKTKRQLEQIAQKVHDELLKANKILRKQKRKLKTQRKRFENIPSF